MPSHNLIESVSFAPESLAVAYEAFDLAWKEVAPQFGDDPTRIEFARNALAHAVLTAAERESKDPSLLKSAALEVFEQMKQSKG